MNNPIDFRDLGLCNFTVITGGYDHGVFERDKEEQFMKKGDTDQPDMKRWKICESIWHERFSYYQHLYLTKDGLI